MRWLLTEVTADTCQTLVPPSTRLGGSPLLSEIQVGLSLTHSSGDFETTACLQTFKPARSVSKASFSRCAEESKSYTYNAWIAHCTPQTKSLAQSKA